MQSQLHPVHGPICIEEVHATYDFRKWLFGAEIQIKGLGATHAEPDANHVWRFSSRGTLSHLKQEVLCQNDSWLHLEPQASDVILSVKQHMRSTGLSQDNVLCLPAKIARLLSDSEQELEVMPYRETPDSLLRDWEKTAEAVAKAPWTLLKAQAYLLSLAKMLRSGVVATPEKLVFIFQEQQGEPGNALPLGEMLDLQRGDVRPARKIRVDRTKKPMKRPAAAAAVTDSDRVSKRVAQQSPVADDAGPVAA